MSAQSDCPDVSVVVPVYEEVENIGVLYRALNTHLEQLNQSYEVILVDDGSKDGSWEELQRLAVEHAHYTAIRLRRNFGQSAALAAGIDHARGAVIVLMDADLQNDPADIPKLLAGIQAGFDIVSGWREKRQDTFLLRVLPSQIANWLISHVTGVHLHDYGCTLKAYRSEVLKGVRIYGEMHRFLPALAFLNGAHITEIPIRHHPRQYGRSKYGINRVLKVSLDLLTVKFLSAFGTKPIYAFGGTGIMSLFLSLGVVLWLIYDKLFHGKYLIESPLLLLSVLLFLVGIQLLALGLVAELVMRTWHESQDKKVYDVHAVVGGEKQPGRMSPVSSTAAKEGP